jgi:hypothetical protein
MISIKRFLDQYRDETPTDLGLVDALKQMGRLLLDCMALHNVRGSEADLGGLRETLNSLASQIDQPQDALGFLGIASEAAEALESYCCRTTDYLRAEKEQVNSMVGMLTDTLTEVTGQTDCSINRLHAIEQDLEEASGLNDMQAVRSNLERSLVALREAVKEQKNSSAAARELLSNQLVKAESSTSSAPSHKGINFTDIDYFAGAPANSTAPSITTYIAAFKLQRAENIVTRFGEATKHEMLLTLGRQLKAVVGPDDRLLRWKGTSFVMFITSKGTLGEIKTPLYDAVAKVGMQYIEVGRKSALLAVGVDWIIFPQAEYPTLEAAFAKVDDFLAASAPASPRLVLQR